MSSEVESKIGPTDASLGYDLNPIVGQRSPAMNPQQPLFLASSHIREEIEYHQSRHPDGVAAGVGMEVLSAEDASKRERWNLAAISPRAALKSSFTMVPLLLLTDAFFAQKTILFSLYKSPVIAAENCEHNKPGKAVDNVGHRRPGERKNRRGRLPLASSFTQGSRCCAYRLDRCFILQRVSTAAEKMKNTRGALEWEHN